MKCVSKLEDVRGVGPLEELSLPDLNARTAMAYALMRLLPRLQPADAEWLNASQRAALHRVLQISNPDKETEFMLVILRALTRIEDVSALPTLNVLARRAAITANEER